MPGVIAALECDSISDMAIVLAKDKTNGIQLNDEDFEPEIAEFLERMNTAENCDSGSRMLRHGAFLVTKHASESWSVAEGFLSFAIDWEFEGHKLHSILKRCGATAASLR